MVLNQKDTKMSVCLFLCWLIFLCRFLYLFISVYVCTQVTLCVVLYTCLQVYQLLCKHALCVICYSMHKSIYTLQTKYTCSVYSQVYALRVISVAFQIYALIYVSFSIYYHVCVFLLFRCILLDICLFLYIALCIVYYSVYILKV